MRTAIVYAFLATGALPAQAALYSGMLNPEAVALGSFDGVREPVVGLPTRSAWWRFSGTAGDRVSITAQSADGAFNAIIGIFAGAASTVSEARRLELIGSSITECSANFCSIDLLRFDPLAAAYATLPSTGDYSVALIGTCLSFYAPSCYGVAYEGAQRARRDFPYQILLGPGELPTRTPFVPSPVVPAPEPAMLALFGLGAAVLAARRRRITL